jgi:uncharacterized membrane protein
LTGVVLFFFFFSHALLMMVAFYAFKTVHFICRCVLRMFRRRKIQVLAEDHKAGPSFV